MITKFRIYLTGDKILILLSSSDTEIYTPDPLTSTRGPLGVCRPSIGNHWTRLMINDYK